MSRLAASRFLIVLLVSLSFISVFTPTARAITSDSTATVTVTPDPQATPWPGGDPSPNGHADATPITGNTQITNLTIDSPLIFLIFGLALLFVGLVIALLVKRRRMQSRNKSHP
jgi:uncharacterized membrane protein SpoIIM required for sporulation